MTSGEAVWTGPLIDSPAAVEGVVVGADDPGGETGMVLALDIATGEVRWSRPGHPGSTAFVDVLAVGDGVFVVFSPNYDGHIGYELADGATRWNSTDLDGAPLVVEGESVVLVDRDSLNYLASRITR